MATAVMPPTLWQLYDEAVVNHVDYATLRREYEVRVRAAGREPRAAAALTIAPASPARGPEPKVLTQVVPPQTVPAPPQTMPAPPQTMPAPPQTMPAPLEQVLTVGQTMPAPPQTMPAPPPQTMPAPEPVAPPAMPGLKNMGSTCYVNAVLQALRMTPAMGWGLQDGGGAPTQVEPTGAADMAERAVGEALAGKWRELQIAMWGAPESQPMAIIPPTVLLNAIQAYNLTLLPANRWLKPVGTQGDSAQFASGFLNALAEHEQAGPSQDLRRLSPEATFRAYAAGSKLKHSMSFLEKRQHVCTKCGREGDEVLVSDDALKLSITGDEGDDCLRDYFKTKTIDYTCEHCETKGTAEERHNVVALPPCLCIHVKRMEADWDIKEGRVVTRKNRKTLWWDVQNVDLSAYGPPQGGIMDTLALYGPNPRVERTDGKYIVYATVRHTGELEDGHYTAVVRTGGSGDNPSWTLCNDASTGPAGGRFTPGGGQDTCMMYLCRPAVWDAFVQQWGPLKELGRRTTSQWGGTRKRASRAGGRRIKGVRRTPKRPRVS